MTKEEYTGKLGGSYVSQRVEEGWVSEI